MNKMAPRYVVNLAKNMRKDWTKTENIMWNVLRGRKVWGKKFLRQHPFWRYIVDFYCNEAKLVIEIDWKIHEQTIEYDEIRQELIEKYWIKFLRFTTEEVLNNLDKVIETIKQNI